MALVLFALAPTQRYAGAATVTWLTTTGTNYWDVGANWVGGAAPTNGDDVIIATNNIGVLLTNSTAPLSSLLISNKATLIFSNWDTKLSATNVTIATNAAMMLPGAFSNSVMSNRVWIACSNLTVRPGGSINVDGKGYKGGTVSNQTGAGPGGGKTYGGAGYGGMGGGTDAEVGGGNYGSASAPIDPGSGGGYGSGDGGDGGGAIRIEASGALTVDGVLTANGTDGPGNNDGGGSGGGIYIVCSTVSGSGTMRANGGYGNRGGGAGGRIAVNYDPSEQSALPVPTVWFSVNTNGYRPSDLGTLYFPDTRFLTTTMRHIGQIVIPGFTNWSPSSLTISNGWIRFPSPGFQLTVTGDVTLVNTGRLDIGGDSYWTNNYVPFILYNGTATGVALRVGGNLSLGADCRLSLCAGMTNAGTPDYGALLDVTGNVSLTSNAWIYPQSHLTNGGSVLMRASNLTIASGGGINADYAGYVGSPSSGGYGPGSGGAGSAGAYGGYGYNTYFPSTNFPYGSSNAPVDPGSGGSSSVFSYHGGAGGGLIRVQVRGVAVIDGILTANGKAGSSYGQDGSGGSGGGIYLSANSLAGATSSIFRANGGAGGSRYGGGSGGGRIAVWRIYHTYAGSTSVTNGTGGSGTGTPGTIFWGQLPVPGTIVSFR